MAGLITDLSSIGAIDRTADVLEIVDVSANASFKVTPNALVGISGGSVLSTTDSQTIQNKTLDNTNALTVKDGSLTIQNTASTTKQAVFSASAITAGQTRTLTIPDVSGTLVLLAATQTLTNKTLTSPVITGGTIDNSTITVDALNGHTTPTIVTVAGLQINNGVVGTNGVATASIADSAVTPAKLLTGTGSGWAWGSWTPTQTNWSKGNGTVSATYIQIGKTVIARFEFTLGSTSTIGSDPSISLPVTAVAYNGSTVVGTAGLTQTGTVFIYGSTYLASTTTAKFQVYNASGVYVFAVGITATVPFTWATSHVLTTLFTYEAA